MKIARDFRAEARGALRGHWGIAILAFVVASLLGGIATYNIMTTSLSNTDQSWVYSLDVFGWEWSASIRNPISKSFAMVLSAYSAVCFFIGGAIQLGYQLFNIDLLRGAETGIYRLFDRMSIFGRALGLRLLTTIFIMLWSLLLIVPGIIAAYSYALAPYLMAEYPEMSCREALRTSKQRMIGNKGRLFCLDLSFIGWLLLAALTMGIGMLFVSPYLSAAHVAFYEEIAHRQDA